MRSRRRLAKPLLAALCMLWFGAADPAPVAAFGAEPAAAKGRFKPAIELAQNDIWVQFFEQNRSRSRRNQRRKGDLVPLRTDPGEQQPLMPEFRRPDRNRDQKQREEQDAAREAVRRGDILPLGGIIESVQSQCPGKFLGAKLQRGGDGFSYRVRILRPSGRRVGLTVDAKTGAVVGDGCR
ncbi:MAG: hypothetical protein O3C34_00265 [Proteobacteria bacterium]|nr:hypothetical protein [Pseudomonadota bacterium]